MGILEESDIRRLVAEPQFAEQLTKALLEDPAALEELAEDIADDLGDVLEDDPTFRTKIMDAAMASEQFRSRLVRKLVADLGD